MKNQQYSNTTKVGLSPMASVLPFALFVATTISLSFFNAVNIDLLVATGIACGLAFLRGGTHKTLTLTIQNMASSITGMICDGWLWMQPIVPWLLPKIALPSDVSTASMVIRPKTPCATWG